MSLCCGSFQIVVIMNVRGLQPRGGERAAHGSAVHKYRMTGPEALHSHFPVISPGFHSWKSQQRKRTSLWGALFWELIRQPGGAGGRYNQDVYKKN